MKAPVYFLHKILRVAAGTVALLFFIAELALTLGTSPRESLGIGQQLTSDGDVGGVAAVTRGRALRTMVRRESTSTLLAGDAEELLKQSYRDFESHLLSHGGGDLSWRSPTPSEDSPSPSPLMLPMNFQKKAEAVVKRSDRLPLGHSDMVYAIGSEDKAVYAQRASTMTPLSNWTKIAAGKVVSIATHNDYLYALKGDGRVYMQNLSTVTCESVWGQPLSREIARTIAVTNSQIYALLEDKMLYKQNLPLDANQIQNWALASKVLPNQDGLAVFIQGDTIYLVKEDSKVYRQPLKKMQENTLWIPVSQVGVRSVAVVRDILYGVMNDSRVHQQPESHMDEQSPWGEPHSCSAQGVEFITSPWVREWERSMADVLPSYTKDHFEVKHVLKDVNITVVNTADNPKVAHKQNATLEIKSVRKVGPMNTTSEGNMTARIVDSSIKGNISAAITGSRNFSFMPTLSPPASTPSGNDFVMVSSASATLNASLGNESYTTMNSTTGSSSNISTESSASGLSTDNSTANTSSEESFAGAANDSSASNSTSPSPPPGPPVLPSHVIGDLDLEMVQLPEDFMNSMPTLSAVKAGIALAAACGDYKVVLTNTTKIHVNRMRRIGGIERPMSTVKVSYTVPVSPVHQTGWDLMRIIANASLTKVGAKIRSELNSRGLDNQVYVFNLTAVVDMTGATPPSPWVLPVVNAMSASGVDTGEAGVGFITTTTTQGFGELRVEPAHDPFNPELDDPLEDAGPTTTVLTPIWGPPPVPPDEQPQEQSIVGGTFQFLSSNAEEVISSRDAQNVVLQELASAAHIDLTDVTATFGFTTGANLLAVESGQKYRSLRSPGYVDAEYSITVDGNHTAAGITAALAAADRYQMAAHMAAGFLGIGLASMTVNVTSLTQEVRTVDLIGPEAGCQDANQTGITMGGNPATCAQLSAYCTDSTHGAAIRNSCPVTCDACQETNGLDMNGSQNGSSDHPSVGHAGNGTAGLADDNASAGLEELIFPAELPSVVPVELAHSGSAGRWLHSFSVLVLCIASVAALP